MSDLHNVLVGLVRMSADERRAAFVEHAEVLFGQQVVEYIEQQHREANHDAASVGAAGPWSEIPAFVAESFVDGARQWADGVDTVWSEMISFAAEAAQQEPNASPAPVAAGKSSTAPSGGGYQPVPSTAVGTGPTDDEILQDHVEFVRQEYDNFQNDLEFNRVRDDAIDYSTPSYDSYSYDSY